MLGKRFANDSVPLLQLNPLQLEMKQQIDGKVMDGRYQFESVSCPVCDQINFDLLAEKDRYGLYMPVVICKHCGLIQTNPRMTQESYNKFYNDEYRKLYVGSETASQSFFDNQYRKGTRIFDYLVTHKIIKNTPTGMRVLEVGCGAGGILQVFRNRGAQVRGIDLGEEYLQFGREHYSLDLEVGTIHDLKDIDPPDLLIYSHVLEHILDPNQELATIQKILPATGLLYIEVPGVKNLLFSYEMDFLRLMQNAHVYHFTLKTLTNLLGKNGYHRKTGNEDIFSVFQLKAYNNAPFTYQSDYLTALRYLKRVERLRQIYPLKLTRAKNIIRKFEYKLRRAMI